MRHSVLEGDGYDPPVVDLDSLDDVLEEVSRNTRVDTADVLLVVHIPVVQELFDHDEVGCLLDELGAADRASDAVR